jgi:hypothetical protein
MLRAGSFLVLSVPAVVDRAGAQGAAMNFVHEAGVKPTGATELGRGADGVALEVLDHPELILKEMNHPFKLGRNRAETPRVARGARHHRRARGDPTFDNVRWGYTAADPEPRWILIDP